MHTYRSGNTEAVQILHFYSKAQFFIGLGEEAFSTQLFWEVSYEHKAILLKLSTMITRKL